MELNISVVVKRAMWNLQQVLLGEYHPEQLRFWNKAICSRQISIIQTTAPGMPLSVGRD